MKTINSRIIREEDNVTVRYYNGLLGLLFMTKYLPINDLELVYQPPFGVQDYQTEGRQDQVATISRSVTIIPDGDVMVHCEGIEEPRLWEASLYPVSYRLFLKDFRSWYQAITPATMFCVSPENSDDRILTHQLNHVIIEDNETYQFGEYDIAFICMLGEDQYSAFEIEQGDTYQSQGYTVLAIWSEIHD